MCLPNSPNFNPMELWASGAIEALTNRGPHTTKTALITTMKEAFSIMDKENINNLPTEVSSVGGWRRCY